MNPNNIEESRLPPRGSNAEPVRPATDNDEEVRLLSRIARFQDMRALERIYELYKSRLVPFMARFLKSPESIEELYDDIMLVVWKKAGQFDGRSKVSTWIFAIAYHKAIRQYKKESRRREVGGEAGDIALEKAIGPDDAVGETADLIRAALNELSPDHRLVVELSYFSGQTYGEIAEIAGVPENTIKTRMFHARRKLETIVGALS